MALPVHSRRPADEACPPGTHPILPERQNDFLVMKAILDWDLKE